MSSDDDSDWGDDFDIPGAPPVQPKTQVVLSGVKAKEGDEENWDDDFAWEPPAAGAAGADVAPAETLNASSIKKIDLSKSVKGPAAEIQSESSALVTALKATFDKVSGFKAPATIPAKPAKKTDAQYKHIMETFQKRIQDLETQEPPPKIDIMKITWEMALQANAQSEFFDSMEMLEDTAVLANEISEAATSGSVPAIGNMPDFKANVQFQLGLAAKSLQDPGQAADFFKAALRFLNSQEQNYELWVMLHFELGYCQFKLEEPLPCLDFYNVFLSEIEGISAKSTSFVTDNWESIVQCCYNIGSCLMKLTETKLGRKYLETAQTWAKESKFKEIEEKIPPLLTSLVEDRQSSSALSIKSDNSDQSLADKDGSSTKHSELAEASDDENWDDIDGDVPVVPKVSFVLTQHKDLNENINPQKQVAKYKLLKEENRVVTVTYPPPTVLYSMRTREGHTLLNEKSLEQWLAGIATKHRPATTTKSQKDLGSMKAKLDAIKPKKPSCETFDWINSYLEITARAYPYPETQECWNKSIEFFKVIRDLHLSTPSSSSSSKDPKKKPTSNYTKPINNVELQACLIVLHYIGKLWAPDKDNEFNAALDNLSNLHPCLPILASVVRVETLSHYQRKGTSVIKTLIACYEAAHRQFTNLPPNSTANVAWEILLHVQIRSLTDLHLHLVFRSPLTTETQPELLEEDSAAEDGIADALCVDSHRMKLLTDLYATAPNDFFKAKAAYALGLHHCDTMDDHELAERLFFEAVYMLDTLEPIVNLPFPVPVSSGSSSSKSKDKKKEKDKSGLSSSMTSTFELFRLHSPVVSELGSNALVHYGDLLYLNRKYKYASQAFDSALTLFNMRSRHKQFFGLMRRVAKIAQSENDLSRAIELYEEIVQDYRSTNRTNEAIYVFEILCGMHMEMGQFKSAISCLQIASEMMPDHLRFTSPTESLRTVNMDPLFLRLQLTTARAYLASYSYDKGIELLEKLMHAKLSTNLMATVTELLARAYLKKRWFKETSEMLMTWQSLQQRDVTSPLLSARPASTPASAIQDSNYWELSAKNFYHHRKYPEAVRCVDNAIILCALERYSALGRLYYTRGKIFQEICRAASSFTFPTRLPCPLSLHHIQSDSSKLPEFTSASDLVQECAATFRQAYKYFRTIGDDSRVAKSLSALAETYLDHLFWPVSTSELIFEEQALLPYFEVSMIARNVRAESHQSALHSRAAAAAAAAKRATKSEPASLSNTPSIVIKEDRTTQSDSSKNKDAGQAGGGSGILRAKSHKRTQSDYSSNRKEDPLKLANAKKPRPPSDLSTLKSAESAKKNRHKSAPRDVQENDSDSNESATSNSSRGKGRPKIQHRRGSARRQEPRIEEFDDDSWGDDSDSEKELDKSGGQKTDTAITFETIENASRVSLEVCCQTSNILLLFKGYLNYAEQKLLQKNKELALAFWNEWREVIGLFFMDGPRIILHDASPAFMTKMLHLFRRAVRVLLFFDKIIINKNLDIIDAYILLEGDTELSHRKAVGAAAHVALMAYDSSLSAHLKNLLKSKAATVSSVSRPIGRGSSPSPSLDKNSPVVINPDEEKPFSSSLPIPDKNLSFQAVAAETATHIWGNLCYLKQQQVRYGDGKIAMADISERNQRCLRKMSRLAAALRMHDAKLLKEYNLRLDPSSTKRATRRRTRWFGTPIGKLRERSDSLAPLSSPRKPQTFDEILQEKSAILGKLVYITQIDERIIHYVPVTGEKRIQRFGRKIDYDATGSSSLAPSSVQTVYINIELLIKSEESITLAVPSEFTLAQVLRYVCDKDVIGAHNASAVASGANSGSGEKKSVGFFETLLGGAKERPIVMVRKTTNFSKEFGNLLAPVNEEPGRPVFRRASSINLKAEKRQKLTRNPNSETPGAAPGAVGLTAAVKQSPPTTGVQSNPSQANLNANTALASPLDFLLLARKSRNVSGKTSSNVRVVPLRSKLNKRVTECFSSSELQDCTAERPMKLVLYMSSTLARQAKAGIAIGESLMFSEDVMQYLRQLIKYDKEQDRIFNSTDNILDELRHSMSPLFDILPGQEGTSTLFNLDKNSSFWPKFLSDPATRATHKPLTLVCSKYLHAFPWELIIKQDIIIRSFSLHDLLAVHNPKRPEKKRTQSQSAALAPNMANMGPLGLISCYFSRGSRELQPRETERKDIIVNNMQKSLNYSFLAVDYSTDSFPLFPFNSPLIRSPKKIDQYKKKYKALFFADMLDYFHRPEDISNIFHIINTPVFLFTFADLLEMSQAMTNLRKHSPPPVFVFVPDYKFKQALQKLIKLQASTTKASALDPYQLLMGAAYAIKVELNIPVAVFYPPAVQNK